MRKAIREPVHRLYVRALRPMLEAAVGRGELAPDTDVDALLSVVVLLLPRLALAPFEPGWTRGWRCPAQQARTVRNAPGGW